MTIFYNIHDYTVKNADACESCYSLDFSHMPELYIITITDYDVFGKEGIVYSFENRCEEYPEVKYNDRLHFVYFNTRGCNGGSREIKNMLTYIQDSRRENAVDESTKLVDSLVNRVKNAEEVRDSYMTFGDVIDREKQESFEQGIEQGRKLIILQMLENGRSVEEIAKFIGEDINIVNELDDSGSTVK